MKPLVYLASPYSDPNPEIREQRFRAVCKYAAGLMRLGDSVFSPIAHTHPIALFDLPKGRDFWQQYDEKMLSVCDSMIVLMLPGWEKSKGIAGEIAIMELAGKHIEWHSPDGACVRETPAAPGRAATQPAPGSPKPLALAGQAGP
jgi:hypothetical protein